MECKFSVGQKVVCVEEFESSRFPMDFPEKHKVYTVRQVVPDPDGVYLRLVEIVNPIFQFDDGNEEPAFEVEAFRPVVERKTDISQFQRMLTDTKVEEPA